MRRLIFLLLLLSACQVKEPELEGSYSLVGVKKGDAVLLKEDTAKRKTIKIIKNGYWLSATFSSDKKATVENASGGTYKVENNRYVETLSFSSQDEFLVGKVYSYSYKLHNSNYVFDRIMGDTKCENCFTGEEYSKIKSDNRLTDASIEGVWKMKEGQAGYNTNNQEVIRLFAYPSFIRTIYSLKEKRFINTYGGTYKFDGKELIEKIEYSNYQIQSGSSMEWSVKKLTQDEILLFDIDSFNDEEIFDQLNNQ